MSPLPAPWYTYNAGPTPLFTILTAVVVVKVVLTKYAPLNAVIEPWIVKFPYTSPPVNFKYVEFAASWVTQLALFEFNVVNAEFPPIQLALFEFKVVCALTQLALFVFIVVKAELPPIQLALFELTVVNVFCQLELRAFKSVPW